MTRTALLVVAVASVMLAGCGDDAPEEQATSTPAPVQTATAAPTEDAAAPEEPDEPAQRTYRVRRGDTLSAIARRFDTTVRAIVRLNDIDNPNEIRAGQRLKIPGG